MTWTQTALTDLLNTEYPIIQAPMAGATSPDMAVAASNAGALGSLGCAFMSGDDVTREFKAAQAATNRQVNLNFFTHEPPRHDAALNELAMARLAPWYDRLSAGTPQPPAGTGHSFDEAMCDAVLSAGARLLSFHFGLPPQDLVARLKASGAIVLSSATSAAEARWLEDHGADAVIAQGAEAGGHNGWFLPRNGADVASTMALVPRVVDTVSVPVIAAGGIADGRGIAAALMLGAAGVQIGTAFLATPESRTAQVHKEAVAASSGDETIATKAFSGRTARSLVNDFARDMAAFQDWPDFPMMNAATGPLRAASAKQGVPDGFALWAGQGVGLARPETTEQVVKRLVRETEARLSEFNR